MSKFQKLQEQLSEKKKAKGVIIKQKIKYKIVYEYKNLSLFFSLM